MKRRIKSFFARFDRRLNDPKWLSQKYHEENRSVQAIADIVGCDTELVQRKLQKLGLLGRDKILDVYTGRFHGFGKKAVIILMKPHIKKVETTVDEIYTKTKSRNCKIFKEILSDMERLDKDTGSSSALSFGLTRKAFYILLAKFLICLYDYDTYYAERIDYILKETLKRKDEFYLDEQSNPENWCPNRTHRMLTIYIFARNLPKGEQCIVVNASDLIKAKEEKEKGRR